MIEVRNLKFAYDESRVVIDDISFDIADGECVGIVGRNGAGKSTLISLMMGLVYAQSGTITLDAVVITKKTVGKIREIAGLVFQNPDDQLFMPNVFDDIAFGLRNMKMSEDEVKKTVNMTLEKMEIAHLADRPPHKLSGGEKRIVAMSTVLAMNPSILLLDEPTSFMDHQARRNTMNILQSLKQTRIITTHDIELVVDICDKVILLEKGQIAAMGDTVQILSDQGIMTSCKMEIPYRLQTL
jgi:cobalt/nickel transport system ATP-binding protein